MKAIGVVPDLEPDGRLVVRLPMEEARTAGMVEGEKLFAHVVLGAGIWLSSENESDALVELTALVRAFGDRTRDDTTGGPSD